MKLRDRNDELSRKRIAKAITTLIRVIIIPAALLALLFLISCNPSKRYVGAGYSPAERYRDTHKDRIWSEINKPKWHEVFKIGRRNK